jgi:hypothetical protein
MNNPVVVDENNRRIVVVVTGFGPFECVTENPSSLIVEQLRNGDPLDGIELIAEILPVRYDVVADTIDELWRQHKPSVSVCDIFISIFLLTACRPSRCAPSKANHMCRTTVIRSRILSIRY